MTDTISDIIAQGPLQVFLLYDTSLRTAAVETVTGLNEYRLIEEDKKNMGRERRLQHK